MKNNIQHPTFNVQRQSEWHDAPRFECWALNVECSIILFLAISILPLCAQTTTNALPPLAPAYPKMPPTFWEQNGGAILIGAVISLALAAFALWQLLKSKPQPIQPPETVAHEALARLQGQTEDGKVLSEVSQILRRYVGTMFGFSGGELTTTEFSAAATADVEIGPQLANALATFLQACDKDKFIAKNEAPPLNAVQHASQLVDQIERRRKELNALKSSS